MSDISDADVLKYAIESGIIDKTLVQKQIEMTQRQEYLDNHPYSIWKDKKSRTWNTYLPDETKKDKRKRIKKSTQKEIEDVVIAYYKDIEENPTVNEIFLEWLNAKHDREDIAEQTYERYMRQWELCLSDFSKCKIKGIDEYDIEQYVLDTIHEKKLTAKSYSNLRTLIYGTFRLAKKKKLIDYSITEVMKDIEISRKTFRKIVHEDEEQVFMIDELPKIVEYLEQTQDIFNMAILLMFKSGLRVGEVAALKKCDIENGYIEVKRTEIFYGTGNNRVFEVRDFPKTEAGIRDVVIPDKDQWIFKRIKELNPFGEYLFMHDGERIRAYKFRDRLKSICKKLDIVPKSPHKIRKTYGSILLDANVPESVIISQMGHTDIRTTRQHYYKNRQGIADKQNTLNDVVGL